MKGVRKLEKLEGKKLPKKKHLLFAAAASARSLAGAFFGVALGVAATSVLGCSD